LGNATFASLGPTNLGASSANHGVPVDVAGTSTYKIIPDCTDAAGNHLNYTQSTDAFSCGTTTSASPTLTKYTSTLPMTMSTTNMETVASNMGTPAAGVYNLPAAAANLRKCLKDGSTNFATNNATVKGPAGNIYYLGTTVSATTGIVMNQAGEELCFMSDGTDWYVE
jgi:hypothetical protein